MRGMGSVMKLSCYQLQENNCITAVSRQDINDETGAYWLEIADATSDELASELATLNLHPLIIEDCLTIGYSTMIDRYETAVYAEFPINQTEAYGRTTYLSLIFTPNLLISIRQGKLPGMDTLSALLQNENFMYDSNLRALIYHILNYFIGQELTAVRQLRDQVDALTHAFETDAANVEVETVAAMKRRVSSASDVSEDRFYSLKSFLSVRSESLDTGNEKPYLHDLISDAEYTFRMIQRLEDRLRDLRGDFQLMAHDETEKRLRILTVISAVLLPLTLISGIFGMNFETMYLLSWQHGYTFTMGSMGLIAVIMIIYFARHGWFD
jgi:magnesium transporter